MKKSIGLVRVLTTNDEDVLYAHERILEEKFEFDIETKCIEEQYEGIHTHELFDEAVPKIIKLCEDFQDKDVILISCCDDPAVKELRKIHPNKLIVGAGEATMALSSFYSSKIAVLGIVDYFPRAFQPFSDKLKLVKPNNINSTLDLADKDNWEEIIILAKKLKTEGYGVIALACTGFATVGLSKVIEKEAGIAVVDPVLAQGVFANYEIKK